MELNKRVCSMSPKNYALFFSSGFARIMAGCIPFPHVQGMGKGLKQVIK